MLLPKVTGTSHVVMAGVVRVDEIDELVLSYWDGKQVLVYSSKLVDNIHALMATAVDSWYNLSSTPYTLFLVVVFSQSFRNLQPLFV